MVCLAGVVLAVGRLTVPMALAAQQAVAAEAEPRGRTTSELLSRQITVQLDRVTVREAVVLLGKAAKIRVQYQSETLAGIGTPVTLHARNMTLGIAFETVLSGTGLRAVPLAADVVNIQPAVVADSTESGAITGYVVVSRRPLRDASVWLDDSTHAVRTDDEGQYRFIRVAPGTHHVSVRALGFARQVRLVQVSAGRTATVEFALQSSINTLDQVVVTATGEQRVRELGHVVAQINADSLVKSAPISSVAELLQSRVPGLQILTGQGGTVGGTVSLRLRGQTTVNLDAEPIVIVDGVRFKSDNRVQRDYGYVDDDKRGVGETRSPLYDLNPNDIETVEVVKGPSASTLYGPDAANGVIVITTKRGQSGRTEFKWYARPVTNSVPTATVSRVYQAYGHDPTTGQLFNGNCSLIYQYEYQVCVLDSIALVPTLIGNPEYAVFAKNRPMWQAGASVSGGSSAIRYFLSANYDWQVGALQTSRRIAQYLESILGTPSLSGDIRQPNTMRDMGGHASVAFDLTSKTAVTATIGYTQTTRLSSQGDAAVFYGINPGTDTTDAGNLFNPYTFLTVSNEQASRITGALNGVYRATSWLTGTMTVGMDLAPSVVHTVLPRVGSVPDYASMAEDSRRSYVGRTMNVGLTATARPDPLSFRSSIGVQYAYDHTDGVDLNGSRLAPGSSSVQTASQLTSQQVWSEVASLGTYGEEVVGFRDRLFLTGSLRLDGSSSFGDAYHPTPTPKVGISWIASDEPFLKNIPGLRELRFRASYGAASRYPTSGMKLGVQQGYLSLVDGNDETVFDRSQLGNPALRPERTRETEYGADATLWGSAVQVGLTWYRRRTVDQLLLIQNALGLPPQYGNLGLVTAHGFEVTANANLITTSAVRADLGFTYAFHTDKVLSLGSAPDSRGNYGGYAVGYPLASEFGFPIVGVADTVGGGPDGIIFSNEFIRDSVNRFLGVTLPPRTYTFTPSIAFWGGYVRVSTTVDRETGFVLLGSRASGYSGNLCLAAYERDAPVMAQAQCYMNTPTTPGDFTRWRELTATFTIPSRFLRLDLLHLQFSQASFSVQGRNLRLWSQYAGSDPESRIAPATIDPSAGGIPQSRTWSVRFDITP